MRPTEVHQFPHQHSDKMRGTGLGWFGGLILLVLALMAFSYALDWTLRQIRPVVEEKIAEAMHAVDAATLARVPPR